jgi:hypothetical protein
MNSEDCTAVAQEELLMSCQQDVLKDQPWCECSSGVTAPNPFAKGKVLSGREAVSALQLVGVTKDSAKSATVLEVA